MQIKKLAPSLIEQWIRAYEQERPNLKPNAVTGEALAAYLEAHHKVTPLADEAVHRAVCDAVLSNAFFAAKLPKNKAPRPAVYVRGDGATVGLDLETGWFFAEGDPKLRDELTYIRGLDEADLQNVLRTVDWLRCKKLFGKKCAR